MFEYTFKKEERLSGKIAISKLFNSGKSFFFHPFMVFYTKREASEDDLPPVRLMVSVSKKNYKQAVKRNLIKRRIKEAYRTNKPALLGKLGSEKLDVALIYISKEIHPFSFIERRIMKTFDKIAGKE